MSERRDNSGTLGANRERRNERDPSHRGQVVIEGREYWVSAWVKENREDGSRFFSLAFTPKRASEHAGGVKNPPARTARSQRATGQGDAFDDPPSGGRW